LKAAPQYSKVPLPVNLPAATTFRMPFWRWYLASLVVSQVLYAVLNLIPAVLDPVGFGWQYYRRTMPIGMTLFPILLAPAMLLYVLLWPVRVAPAGLRASNAWGLFATVSWQSITAVKPVSIPLVPFARVFSTETRRVLWVPLFMRRFPQYVAAVAEYAGNDHPLARELQKRLQFQEEP
jgi:hypothetical protein